MATLKIFHLKFYIYFAVFLLFLFGLMHSFSTPPPEFVIPLEEESPERDDPSPDQTSPSQLQASSVAESPPPPPPPPPSHYKSSDEASNSTLGFGAIYYLSLPTRTDRQDAIELIAALSDLNFTYVPGVNGSAIHEKALPSKPGALHLGPLGCWRSHANAWRKLIKSGMSTALILEDDVDFSIGLKSFIMPKIAEQMQKGLLRVRKPNGMNVEGPYGEDWDVFMLGTCFEDSNPEFPNAYHAWFDPYAPSDKEKAMLLDPTVLKDYGDEARVRVLRPAFGIVCTHGYAVTRRGAMKLLYKMGIEELTLPIDFMIGNLLKKGELMGYTITPPVFSEWFSGGKEDSDSDNDGEPIVRTGHGYPRRGIVDSVRQKMTAQFGEEVEDYWKEFRDSMVAL